MPIQWKRWLFGWGALDEPYGLSQTGTYAYGIPEVIPAGEAEVPSGGVFIGRRPRRVLEPFGISATAAGTISGAPEIERVDWAEIERYIESVFEDLLQAPVEPAPPPVREIEVGGISVCRVRLTGIGRPVRHREVGGIATSGSLAAGQIDVSWGLEEDDIESLIAAGVL